MSHVDYIDYVQINSFHFFVGIVVRRFASHICNTYNKNLRQVKPKKDKGMVKLDFFFSKLHFLGMY